MTLAAAERVTVATDEQHRAARGGAARPRDLRDRSRRRRPPATRRYPRRALPTPTRRACRRRPRRRARRRAARRPSRLPNSTRTRSTSRRQSAAVSSASNTRSTVSSASSRASGNRSTRSHCSTDAPSTSSISRTSSFTRSMLEITTENSSTATCSLRSSTSTPTMSAPIAPIRDATSPSAPGRSGSQTRTTSRAPSSLSGESRVVVTAAGYDAIDRHAPRQRTFHTAFSVESAGAEPAVCSLRTDRRTDRDPGRNVRPRTRRSSDGRGRRRATNSSSIASWWSSRAILGRSVIVSIAPAEVRYEMVVAALDGVDGLVASRIEMDRDGPTYTIDTVEALAAPGRELFLIMGSDVAANLATWHRVDDLRELVTLAIVDREAGRRVHCRRGGAWLASRRPGWSSRRPISATGSRRASRSSSSCPPPRRGSCTPTVSTNRNDRDLAIGPHGRG